MSTKKNRPLIPSNPFRKVTFKEERSKDNSPIIYLSDLVKLEDTENEVYTTADISSQRITFETRDDLNNIAMNEYCVYLGHIISNIVPEIVIDSDGCYNLIFKKK